MSRLDRLLGRGTGLQPAERAPAPAELRSLVARLDELEAMVEALQDSVNRQAKRHDERLNELARQLQPGQLARALSEDARKRGL